LVGPSVQLKPLITHEFPLDDAAKAYQTILDPAAGSLAVILRYPPPSENGQPRTRIDIPGARFVPAGKASLRVGLVGAGNLARWVHLPDLKKIPGVQLQAVCSANGARGKS